jgi:D-lactate dehydrogenase
MTISHFGTPPSQQQYFEQHLPAAAQTFFPDQNLVGVLDQIKACDVLSIFLQTHITADILDQLPNLKLITTRSTGFDHIDRAACKERNITVCNVPSYGSDTVAEHAFALLLALAKNIPVLTERTKQLNFAFKNHQGFDLSGKTLGVIGVGNIGKNMIQIARGFDLKVLAYDIYQDDQLEKTLGFKFVPLDELLAKCDILSLHMPLNDHTKDLLNRETLQKVKPGTVFLNTSRGGLIKNQDLMFALDTGLFSAAGLDTLEGEEAMFQGTITDEQKNILTRDNVLFTPHCAFYTREALERILATTVENIQGFEEGKTVNLV